MRALRYSALALALLVGGYLVSPAEAQGRFWVLVNGALRYTGTVAVVGNQTVTGNLTLTANTSYVAVGVNPAQTGLFRVPNNMTIMYSRNAANNADVPFAFLDTNNIWNLDAGSNGMLFTAVAFASLGTPANGVMRYCSDCTIANPCAGSGTGALAKRLAGAWVCN